MPQKQLVMVLPQLPSAHAFVTSLAQGEQNSGVVMLAPITSQLSFDVTCVLSHFQDFVVLLRNSLLDGSLICREYHRRSKEVVQVQTWCHGKIRAYRKVKRLGWSTRMCTYWKVDELLLVELQAEHL